MTVREQIEWCRAALRAGPLCSWEVADMLLPLLDRLERLETSTPEGEPMARKTPKPKIQSYQRDIDNTNKPILDVCDEIDPRTGAEVHARVLAAREQTS